MARWFNANKHRDDFKNKVGEFIAAHLNECPACAREFEASGCTKLSLNILEHAAKSKVLKPASK